LGGEPLQPSYRVLVVLLGVLAGYITKSFGDAESMRAWRRVRNFGCGRLNRRMRGLCRSRMSVRMRHRRQRFRAIQLCARISRRQSGNVLHRLRRYVRI
jgi:hypothetical protein